MTVYIYWTKCIILSNVAFDLKIKYHEINTLAFSFGADIGQNVTGA